jgi:alpha-beta hydrolase superfamily lysophospholipase
VLLESIGPSSLKINRFIKGEISMYIEVLSKKGSMLFVHGVCHDANCWNNYLDYFAGIGYDTYALSLRGHGRSEGQDHLDEWGLSDYVTDVIKVILSIGEKPIVVGHSMGGAILQKLIGEHEENLKAAVLLAPGVKGGLTLS